jgi:hypothetical protein
MLLVSIAVELIAKWKLPLKIRPRASGHFSLSPLNKFICGNKSVAPLLIIKIYPNQHEQKKKHKKHAHTCRIEIVFNLDTTEKLSTV